ncbi:SAM domain containing protein [Musa troglodytarum]|uniref:Ferredoxin-thioredoxin reductase catalytic chain, chloroplastic n=1 Tax=Musa troglodytarum TaxID=320322 RepID=A0A9E7GGS5_9LILI|nr:SAM domain containing protein [Musa troglodytarum]
MAMSPRTAGLHGVTPLPRLGLPWLPSYGSRRVNVRAKGLVTEVMRIGGWGWAAGAGGRGPGAGGGLWEDNSTRKRMPEGNHLTFCLRLTLTLFAHLLNSYLVEPSEKSVEIMRKFSEQYARKSETYFCMDKGVTSVVIKGLADHKDMLGAPLCPCRHYDDKAAEVAQGFWNCPCVPMRERKECHCMLFLNPDNDFAGKEQVGDQSNC